MLYQVIVIREVFHSEVIYIMHTGIRIDFGEMHQSRGKEAVNKPRGYANYVNLPPESEWDRRRMRAEAGINFSDIIEDKTIDGRFVDMTPATTPAPINKFTFEPIEMTGRSTTCVQAQKYHSDMATTSHSPSVEQILASSFANDVRDLCTSFSDMKKFDNSRRASRLNETDEQPSFASDEFIPSEQVSLLAALNHKNDFNCMSFYV